MMPFVVVLLLLFFSVDVAFVVGYVHVASSPAIVVVDRCNLLSLMLLAAWKSLLFPLLCLLLFELVMLLAVVVVMVVVSALIDVSVVDAISAFDVVHVLAVDAVVFWICWLGCCHCDLLSCGGVLVLFVLINDAICCGIAVVVLQC